MSKHAVGILVPGSTCFAPLIPYIAGETNAGNALTAHLIGNVMYQWVRDTEDIPGATSQTYDLTSEDVGHLIRVRMHFTDADYNFNTVISKPVGPIQGGGEFVNAGTFSVNAGGTSIDIPMPSNIVPGNLLVVWMGGNAARTASPVAGWTFLNDSTIPDYIVAYRIADGSEGAPVTFSYSGNIGLIGQALQFSGVNAITPIGANDTDTGSGTTASNAGITTGSPRSIVLGIVMTNSNQVIPEPSGWPTTDDGTHNGASPFAFGSRTVTKFVAPAGASGPLSTPIASTSWRVSLYEIKLA